MMGEELLCCTICEERDEEVIRLSSGFRLHPACWPRLTQQHINSPRAFDPSWEPEERIKPTKRVRPGRDDSGSYAADPTELSPPPARVALRRLDPPRIRQLPRAGAWTDEELRRAAEGLRTMANQGT